MTAITASDAGTWLDGHMGWHNSYRVVQRAQEYGMQLTEDDRYILAVFENTDGAVKENENETTILPSGERISLDTLADCVLGQAELADKATEYLQSLAPAGFIFEWDMGELSLMHDPECTGCEHDCPWSKNPLGAPFCQVCDDHSEASD